MSTVKNCILCSKEFKNFPYEINRKFCSHECYSNNKFSTANTDFFIGKRFGKTTVIEFIEKKKYFHKQRSTTLLIYKVKCDCGNIRQANHWDLKLGKSDQCRSCGNDYRNTIKIGDKYGKWLVLEEADRYLNKGIKTARQFKCQCECGNTDIIISSFLKNGHSTQCHDCAIKNFGTHRLSNSPTYKSWRGLVARCNNKNATQYFQYGGRGIKVCDRWLKFENFLSDMGIKPKGIRMAIDRIDPDGDYELSNCRWVTSKENNANRRNSKKNRGVYIMIKKDKLCGNCLINNNIAENNQ